MTQVTMANRAPLAYRALFSRGTAAALVVLAAAFLAISQTRVVHDWLAMLHPAWPMWAWWVAAAGVELAILATGLVLANTGRRVLWAWEAGLVAASVLIGVDVSCHCLPAWVRALVGGAAADVATVEEHVIVLVQSVADDFFHYFTHPVASLLM